MKAIRCRIRSSFADTIYGEEVEVEFIDRIRSETEFDSAEALVLQIKQDIQKAKILIGHAPA